MMHSFTVTFEAKYLQAWSQVFLPMERSVLLRRIFFISLKSTKITLKIQISEVYDL